MPRIIKVLLFLFACTQAVHAQNYLPGPDIVVNVEGESLAFPWTGGITAPQFNMMDLDLDGHEDLVVFDRLGNRLLTFRRIADSYEYAPELAEIFPNDLRQWMLLRDFNGDGYKDLFTSTSLGMEVYVNTTRDSTISWRLFHSRAPASSPLLTQGFTSAINLQLNASDIPAIQDVDGDGDLDILVFRFAGGSTVEYHRNYSLERNGTLDSLQMERVISNWGGFRECLCGTFAFDGEECSLAPGKPLHEGGKTLTIADLNNDGLPEAMVSEETCDALFFLKNEGTPETAFMTQVFDYLPGQPYPFFPAAYLEDINADGLQDLLFGSNWPSATENYEEIVPLLLNNGSASLPDFQESNRYFLLDEMIDAGGMSHPAFYDVSGDGLPDLILGHYADGDTEIPSSGLWLFENTGKLGEPSFELKDKDYAGLKQHSFTTIRPEFIDVNGDGIEDLVFSAGTTDGENAVHVVLNSGQQTADFSSSPQLLFPGLGPQDVVSFGQFNDDQDPDLLWGRASGRVDLYAGQRMGDQLNFSLETEGIYGLGNDNSRGSTFVRSTDIDSDGKPDLFRSDRLGNTAWLSNFKDNENGAWAPVFLRINRGSSTLNPGRNAAPALINLLNTKKDQLIMGSAGGGLQIFIQDEVGGPPSENQIVLYPNPVSQEFFRISAPSALRGTIIDTSGRVITSEFNIVPQQRIFVGELSEGMYFLRVVTDEGINKTIPFIIVR